MTEPKQRHGCLAAYLITMLILNVSCLLFWFYGLVSLKQQDSSETTPWWVLAISTIIAIAYLACLIALLKWKKWGFHGFIAVTVAMFVHGLIFGDFNLRAVAYLAEPILLYIILNIGKEKAGWPQLE